MTIAPNHGAIEPLTTIIRRRTLPRPGQILVDVGSRVSAQEVVARARVAQGHRIINVARELDVSVAKVNRYILKQVGESVEENEPLAALRRVAGLRRIMVRSPIEGEVVEASDGVLILEGEPHVIEVRASVPGFVVDTSPPWSVQIETQGAHIRAAWGHGGLEVGEFKIFGIDKLGENAENEDGEEKKEEESTQRLDEIEHRGMAVAVLGPLTEELLKAAERVHVSGLVGASMRAELVSYVQTIGFPVILTEGFGQGPMAAETAALLRENAGAQISLDSGSSEHWRGMRPEIIIPRQEAAEQPAQDREDGSLSVGQRVRILRGPYKSQIGNVVGLPPSPRELPSGLWLKGVIAKLDNDREAFVPFANLELLG